MTPLRKGSKRIAVRKQSSSFPSTISPCIATTSLIEYRLDRIDINAKKYTEASEPVAVYAWWARAAV